MMRRHFLALSIRRTFRNQLKFSTDAAAPISSSGETMEGVAGESTKEGRRSFPSSGSGERLWPTEGLLTDDEVGRRFPSRVWGDEYCFNVSAAPQPYGPMKRLHKVDTKSSPSWKRSAAVVLETAQTVNVSAAIAANAAANAANAAANAANALAALRREFEREDVPQNARSVYDEICGDDTLFEEDNSNDLKKRNQLAKERFEKVLDDTNKKFQKMELKKDINDREKLPLALPDVEIEYERIAGLAVEESLIIFVASSFFGENGQATGIVSHALFYASHKGVPLNLMLSRNLSLNKRIIGPHSLEYAVQDAEKTFPSARYKIFCEHDSTVKHVQDRMMKLRAAEKVPNDKYTKVAKALIATDSSIEVIASDGNLIARYFAHMVGKIGAFMDVNREFDEARRSF